MDLGQLYTSLTAEERALLTEFSSQKIAGLVECSSSLADAAGMSGTKAVGRAFHKFRGMSILGVSDDSLRNIWPDHHHLTGLSFALVSFHLSAQSEGVL